MRLLWARYGDGSGVPEEGVEEASAEVVGGSMSEFFARAVHGTGEVDFSAFEHVGLEVGYRDASRRPTRAGRPPRT